MIGIELKIVVFTLFFYEFWDFGVGEHSVSPDFSSKFLELVDSLFWSKVGLRFL